MPDPLDLTSQAAFSRSLASYMLGRRDVTTVSHADALARGGLRRSVLVAAARGAGGALDVRLLRQGLHYHYLCSRPLPRGLGELVARYGDYKTWPSFDIARSRAKNGPRRIYEDEAAGVYVAETIEGGEIRET